MFVKPKKVIVFANKQLAPQKKIQFYYSNPLHWEGNVRPKYDAVYAPNNPEIEEAYRKAGKEVFRLEGEAKPKAVKQKPKQEEVEVEAEAPTKPANDYAEPAPTNEEVQDIANLSWNELRQKAREVTDEPIKNKEHAIEILKNLE